MLKQIAENIQVEGHPPGKIIHMQSTRQPAADVFASDAVGVGDFLHWVCAGFANVVATDRDRIVFWRVFGAEFNRIGDQADGWFDRENPRAAPDVFFQNVVLCGAAHLRQRHAVFFGDDEIHRHNRRSHCVDGERDADIFDGDSVKGDFHIRQRVNCHAHAPDFSGCQRVVRIQPHL